MELELDQVHQLLRKLASPGRRVFGADEHRFLLNSPLLETEVTAFEQRYCVSLPADYRRFITHVGNGGAGPFYGIFPLGFAEGGPWREGDYSVGVLSRPFPHREAWNALPDRPSDDLHEADPDEAERQLQAFENVYFDTALINGTIPICHQGCAIWVRLVVTGEEAGYLWVDDRANDGGLTRLTLKDGTPATFSSWYYEWLMDPLIL